MNIFVLTSEGHVIVRPDTTWVRRYEDFYVPGFVDSVSASDIICAKVARPGKCIAERFAERYFELMGTGMLLYPDNLLDGSEEAYASAMCLGHTTYLPVPESSKESFSESERAMMRKAFVEVSRMCIIRTGDFIAVETGRRKALGNRSEGPLHLSRNGMPFSIIF